MAAFNCPHCRKQFETEQEQDKIIHCPHCNGTVSIPDENDIAVGNEIGGFEIIRLLGKGGMGNVYLANQTSMNREVALKVLPKQLTRNKESIDKFMREVRMSGKLQHANIVTAIDAGEQDGQYYLAMTYVDGETLEDVIERERMIPEKDALKHALKISDALDYVWSRHEILHKDIKPGNLMIDKNGDAFVLDMGIAQRLGESSLNADGSILGSPFYMSPEQSRGENLTWSSDLYSLGASLYHAIVGEPPFDSDDIQEIIDMHTTAPFPAPAERNPEAKAPKPVIDLLRKMMGKRPKDRHSSWKAFQKEVKQCLNELGKPKKRKAKKQRPERKKAKAPIRSRAPRMRRKSSSAPTLLIAAIIIAAAAVGGYFLFTSLNERKALRAFKDAEDYLAGNPGSVESALDRFVRARPLARGTQYERSVERKIDELEKLVAEKKHASEKFIRNYYIAKDLFKDKRFAEARDALARIPANLDQVQRDKLEGLKTAIEKAIGRQGSNDAPKTTRHDSASGGKGAASADGAAANLLPADVSATSGERMTEKKQAFDEDLVICQDKIRLILVGYGMKKEFSRARDAIKDSRKLFSRKNGGAPFKSELESFGTWSDNMIDAVNGGEKTWLTLFNCGKTLVGARLTTGAFVDGEVKKIEYGKVYVIYKAEDNARKTIVNLSDLSGSQLMPLLRELADQSVGAKNVFFFLLSTGEFSLAKKMVNDTDGFWKKEASKTIKAYMTFKLAKMYKVLNSRFIDDFDKNDAKQAFSQFSEKYQSLPEFKSALRAVEEKY